MNDKEKFVILIVDLPIVLDNFNTEIKPVEAYCGLWHDFSSYKGEQYLFFSNLSVNFNIVSLSFQEFAQNPKSNKDKFIDLVLGHSIEIHKIPNINQLLAIDKIERNRIVVETEYIDDEEWLIEVTGENGYFVEIEGMDYEIDLQNVSEEHRSQEVRKQIYSRIYTFNKFFYDIWSKIPGYVELQNNDFGLTGRTFEEAANNIYQLSDLFVSSLENIKIYSIGEDAYLIGQLGSQNWIGIHHIINERSS